MFLILECFSQGAGYCFLHSGQDIVFMSQGAGYRVLHRGLDIVFAQGAGYCVYVTLSAAPVQSEILQVEIFLLICNF